METSRPLLRRDARGRSSPPGSARRLPIPLLALVLLLHARDAFAARGSAPVTQHYLQYGVGLAAETVASPGAICPSRATKPCILGSGVGLAVRIGYRTRSQWYLGGAYEFSRQESSNLLRLAILQQLRGELRYYFLEDSRLAPYAGASIGGVLYGNEWGSDTGGLVSFLGGGLEFQVSRTSVVGAALGYRPVFLRRWRDSAGQVRADGPLGFGASHLVAGELVFEVRDPLTRW